MIFLMVLLLLPQRLAGKKKLKVLPYSLPSIGPGADPSVQVTLSHPSGSMLPLLSVSFSS